MFHISRNAAQQGFRHARQPPQPEPHPAALGGGMIGRLLGWLLLVLGMVAEMLDRSADDDKDGGERRSAPCRAHAATRFARHQAAARVALTS
jgi:hypothetical protein